MPKKRARKIRHFSISLVDLSIGGSVGPDGTLQIVRSGYVIREVDGIATITCAACGRTSANLNDVKNRYCGNCHKFHEDQQ